MFIMQRKINRANLKLQYGFILTSSGTTVRQHGKRGTQYADGISECATRAATTGTTT